MQVTTNQQYSFEVSSSVGAGSVLVFRRHFQLLYEDTPLRAIRLFLFYLATRGLDALSQVMAFWATSGTLYISLLLETDAAGSDCISVELASKAFPLLVRLDPQFLFKLARSMAALTDNDAIMHALLLAPALEDYGILISWLRSLIEHPVARIRSRAAKLLLQLRPNKGLISHHLHSPDARIRASVLEALWQPQVIRSGQDILPFFRSALSDPNHRVVVNALVGLYRLGQTSAIYQMIALGENKEHLFRAATAWAMGEVDDSRALPTLRHLILDRSFTVRQRASNSLLVFNPPKTNDYEVPRTGLEIVRA